MPQVQLPGGVLALPDQAEESFPIQRREWARLRTRMENLKDPAPWLQSIALVCVGIAPSFFIAWIGWLPVYSSLSASAQLKFDWVAPLLLIVGIAGLVVAGGLFIAHASLRSKIKRDAETLCEDMDDIYAPHRPTGPDGT
jgi:hypothetical protein